MAKMRWVLFVVLLGACAPQAGEGLPPGEKVDGSRIERRVIDGKDCLWYEDGNAHGHVVAFDCDWSAK